MADWIGHLLAQVPQWLFTPLLILVIIVSVIGWAIWVGLDAATYNPQVWPFKPKRAHLGEKKYDKK
jgi:hypothetical protein